MTARAAEHIVPLAEARDISLVGGKAVNLCRLLEADMPIPDGFVVTTDAYRAASAGSMMPPALSDQIRQAYKTLGEPTVAVRSSATAEDLAEASMAGQYETFLDISGAEAVIAAVKRCWQSLQAERVQSYLQEQGIDAGDVTVAVVVQILVPAEVSGVLFTANPRSGALDEMVIEAVYGLGEGLVSGEIQPDVYCLKYDTGQVLDIQVASKSKMLCPGQCTYQNVPEDKVTKSCLTYNQVQDLRRLGEQAQQYSGSPQDIEWAWQDGRFHVLQARPITTLAQTRAYHTLLEDTGAFLRCELDRGRGPWVRHNLSETLPLPSPLTWSLIKPYMSGSGGFGRMYERVGFQPSDTIKQEGFLTLIAGQIYMDCTRSPEMFCADYPYRYDLDLLRQNPDAAQQPPSLPQGSFRQLAASARLGADVTGELRRLAQTLDSAFEQEFTPLVRDWCKEQQSVDLTFLSDEALHSLWQDQQNRVLDGFGSMVFLPSMIEALAAVDLKAFLAEHIWDEDPESLMQHLSVSPSLDVTMQSNVALQELALGKRSLESWLEDYGYRGPGEFDLASPRWTERPEELQKLAAPLADAPSVTERHHQRVQEAEDCLKQLEKQLSPALAQTLQKHVTLLQRYVRFREDGKAVFIQALAQLRRTALEFGRRLDLGNDVFFLHTDELSASLQQGFVAQDRIAARKEKQQAARRLSLPLVIEKDDIPSLSQAPASGDSDCWSTFPVASGTGTGPARIVYDPTQARDLGEGHVLVCPSTDPAWTPLFIKAAGLILERGGALSHGAIVAREMGLPAVVLENATTLFVEGEMLTIDGHRGQVSRKQQDSGNESTESNHEDTHIPYGQRPPLAGQKEQCSNQLGLIAALVWAALLAVIYILPASWLKDPIFGLIDTLLWPGVRGVGMVWTVTLLGAFFAIVPLLIQRYGHDNQRLREAKKRADLLQKQARELPAGSARRRAMITYAAPITKRNLKASMASLAWVLGPMMLVFLWMPERLDPAAWNADPGSLVTVVAELDGEYQAPVICTAASPLKLEETTPAIQTLPPIRAALEDLRREWLETGDLADYPWQLQSAGEQAQEILLASLNQYLAAGVPSQKLTWMLHVPEKSNGTYPVTIGTAGQEHELELVFGNQQPPQPALKKYAAGPLFQIEAIYPRALQHRRFWTPLRVLGGPAWDFGWLGVYIFSYLLMMIVLKKLLNVA